MAFGEDDLAGIGLQSFNHCVKHDDIPPNFTGYAQIFTS
jgi:hypothetical protein